MNSAGAPYYGMLAFALAKRGCTEAMMVEMPESAQDITAYALGTGGKVLCTVLINRGECDIRVSAANLGLGHNLTAMRLLAPRSDSKTDVTFAGTSVDVTGKWRPAQREPVHASDIALPKMSAVVVRN